MKKQHRITGYQAGFSLIELLIALAISAVLGLAAINIMVHSEKNLIRARERGELMHSALAVSEFLRQASWKAGHSSASHSPDSTLAISGLAPASRLHTGYVLDSSGRFTYRNCVGDRRARGRTIIKTTDQWYVRNKDSLSLYCRPGSGTGAELAERIYGADFSFLQQDSRNFAPNAGRFQRSINSVDSFYIKGVIAELVLGADDSFSNLAPVASAFEWQAFTMASADSSFSWRLVFPVALDLP